MSGGGTAGKSGAGAMHCCLHPCLPACIPWPHHPCSNQHMCLVPSRDMCAEPRQQQQQKRRPDPRARQSEFKGLLGGGGGGRDKEDSGLLDVWFERKGSDKGRGSSGSKEKEKRRR